MNPLLLQIRDPDDDIRHHEVDCFARVAGVEFTSIQILDLLNEDVTKERLQPIDCVFVGGSGKYSAAGESSDWLERALESLRIVHGSGTPTFASCWGHQAMTRAMGGTVIHAPETAEVGTIEMRLTDAAQSDPIYGDVSDPFVAQVGHEDTVTKLPPNTTLLVSSDRCPTHAYRFDDAPVYCTQFHPELTKDDLLKRLDAYPEYVESIAGIPMPEFKKQTCASPVANQLVRRFLTHFVR